MDKSLELSKIEGVSPKIQSYQQWANDYTTFQKEIGVEPKTSPKFNISQAKFDEDERLAKGFSTIPHPQLPQDYSLPNASSLYNPMGIISFSNLQAQGSSLQPLTSQCSHILTLATQSSPSSIQSLYECKRREGF